MPYFSLYLEYLSFNAKEIGILTAIVLGMKVFSPYVWSWMGDVCGCRVRVARIAGIAALITFSGVAYFHEFSSLIIVLAVYGFFWNAILPLVETATMAHLHSRTADYGQIRLWGSIGFIVSASVLGWMFADNGIAFFPVAVLILLFLACLSLFAVQEPQLVESSESHNSIIRVIRQPFVWGLLLSCFLMQASHGPYYAFYSIFLEDLGYSRSVVGPLWALGVGAEIAIFFWLPSVLPRYGATVFFQISLVVTSIRWFLIAAFADSVTVIILTQMMHAASFGLFHAAAIDLIHRKFPPRLKGRGQALYSSLSFGLGGAIGSFMAGYAWDQLPARSVFALAGLTALLGFLVAMIAMRKKESGLSPAFSRSP